MDYDVVIGYTKDMVIFRIRENLYAMVGIEGDITYHSNWIYLLRFVQVRKGAPDDAMLEKTLGFLLKDKTDVNALGLVPLDGELKEVQNSYEKELDLTRQEH